MRPVYKNEEGAAEEQMACTRQANRLPTTQHKDPPSQRLIYLHLLSKNGNEYSTYEDGDVQTGGLKAAVILSFFCFPRFPY